MAYDGTEVASFDRVVRYIRENYTNSDGSEVNQTQAERLVRNSREEMDRAEQCGSYAYYVANQIVDVTDLEYIERDDFESNDYI